MQLLAAAIATPSRAVSTAASRRSFVAVFCSAASAAIVAWLAASPAAAVVFTDVTASAGITHLHTIADNLEYLPGAPFFSGGAAAGDFDGDGLVDLVFARLNDTGILYRNLGNGTFEARTNAAGFFAPLYANGIASADIDNDGDLDVYMTSCGFNRNFVYVNDGTGYFVDAGASAVAALANGTVRNGQGVSFGDYDNDGYIDLATSDWNNPIGQSQSRLLRNLGSAQPGAFEDVTDASGINVYRKDRTYRFSPRFVDLDRDGHMDLTFAADFETSQLFWNNGDGTFTDGTIAAGVGDDRNGMGTAFGDYDADGDLDWFITNITEPPNVVTPFGGWNRLYRNEGDRTFTDVTQEAGVRDSRFAWGTTFFDYDNDGDLDLAATNGYNGRGWIDDRTFLWRNDEGVYTDVSDDVGITDQLQGRGLIHLDYDVDGDLDLVVVNNAAAPILYRNDGGNANHYLRINPQGTRSNRDAIGAWITVTPDLKEPERRLVWEIDGGSSFISQNERTAHFGLGDSDDPVDLVTLEWTSGVVQRLFQVAVDQTIVVVEPDQLAAADFDEDGAVDATDLGVWKTNFGLLAAAAQSQGDANRDGVVDGADWILWQRQLGRTFTADARHARIPEPIALAMAAAGLLAIVIRQHARRQIETFWPECLPRPQDM